MSAPNFNGNFNNFDYQTQLALALSMSASSSSSTTKVVEDEDEELQRAPEQSMAQPKPASVSTTHTSTSTKVQYEQVEEDEDEEIQRALAESFAKKPSPTASPQFKMPTVQPKSTIEDDVLQQVMKMFLQSSIPPVAAPAPKPVSTPKPHAQPYQAVADVQPKSTIEDEVLQQVLKMSLQSNTPATGASAPKSVSTPKPHAQPYQAAGEFNAEEVQKAIAQSISMAPLQFQPLAQPQHLHIPHKPKAVVETGLLKTTLATSTACSSTLEMAIEKAKENKKLRINNYAIKRNEVDNAYLELYYPNKLHRNLAVEELRSKYGMFSKGEPLGVGTTTIQLTVEQTIDFQNKF